MGKKNIRRLEDFRNKYPIEDILLAANTASMNMISKQFNISKAVVLKIVKRYGSEQLKTKVSSRRSKRKVSYAKNSPEETAKSQMEDKSKTLTLLMTPTQTLSNLQKKINHYSEKIEQIINSGDELIKLVVRDLTEKNYESQKIESLQKTLTSFMEFKLHAVKLLILSYKTQIDIQEKYINMEMINREMEDTKTLIRIFFNSFNLLNEKNYVRIKNYILECSPPTEAYFYQFEQTYRDYKEKLLKEYKLKAELDNSNLQSD